MLILYLDWKYLLGMAVWLLLLVVAFVGLLRLRRSKRSNRTALRFIHGLLSVWMLLAFLTAGELVFALFVDHSDTYNMTNVSQRWIERHINNEKNDDGFRDVDFPKKVPSGKRRILFFGDSFTVGHGIEDISKRFSDRIAAALDRAHPEKFVVANLGELGRETSWIVAMVQAVLITGYDVDMVVYVYNPNDIEGYDDRLIEQVNRVQQSGPRNFLFRDTYFLNWLYFRFLQAKQAAGTDYLALLSDAYESEAWDGSTDKPKLRPKLIELQRVCREQNVDLRLAVFPLLQVLGPDYPLRNGHKKIVDFCNERGIPVLDLEEVFNQHSGEDLEVNPFDSHPNERAHEIAADAMQKGLLQDLFQPDRPLAADSDDATTPKDK